MFNLISKILITTIIENFKSRVCYVMNCVSESEANVSWLNSKGTWVTYVIMIAFLHFTLLCVLPVPISWTLTNVINSLVSDSVEFSCSFALWLIAGNVLSITLCEGHTIC